MLIAADELGLSLVDVDLDEASPWLWSKLKLVWDLAGGRNPAKLTYYG